MGEHMSKNKAGKIGLGEKVAFASGELYGSGGVAIISLLYLWFIVEIIKIPMGIAGTIIMAARIWDALSDPLMGSISDNTRTKWGRRRPYIFVSGFLVVGALFVLFMPVQNIDSLGVRIAYVCFAHILYSTVSTVFNVPYLSLTSEISENVKERSSMNFARLACGMGSTGICYLIISLLKDQYTIGAINANQFSLIIAGVFSVFFSVPIVFSAIMSKERTPLPDEKLKFSFRHLADTFKLKCFRRLLVMYVFSFVCNEIIANIIMIYVYNVTHNSGVEILGMSLSTVANMSMLVGAAVVMPVSLTMLSKKVAKPVIFMCGIPAFLIGTIGLASFPANSSNPVLIVLCLAVAGIGFGMAQMIPWLVFPDVVDVAELKSNDRNPGAYNGTMTFFKKFTSGIAVLVMAWVLELMGYDEQLATGAVQPDSAIIGMRLMLGLVVPLCLIVAFIAAYMLKITTIKSEKVRYFIEIQRAGEMDSLSEEDVVELDNIKKDLF